MLIALVLILLFLDSAIKMIQALVNGMMRKETMREEGMAITATIIADLETAGRARLEAGPAVVHTGASIMAVEATTEEVVAAVEVAAATEVARTGPTEMTEAGLAAVVSAGEVVAAVGAAVVTEMAQAGAAEMAEAASATTEKVEAVVATEMARTGVVEMTEAGLAAKVMKEEVGASMAGAGEATRNQNQRNQKGK